MSYLTINYHQTNKKKELNIISLQQIVGQHIILDINESIRKILLAQAENRPDKFKVIEEKIFNVLSPNKTNITFSGSGKSPWILLIGSKGIRHKVQLLLIGNRIWGVELDTGIKMKREVHNLGYDRIISLLQKQVKSMINKPDNWEQIEIYLRN